MRFDPAAMPPHVLEFLADRHLATLTTVRADGTAHVVPVGFTWDPDAGLARVITSGDSVKVRLAEASGRAALCQVEGGRWLTLEGPVQVLRAPDEVREGERRYAGRYRVPRENPRRVVLAVRPERVMGRVPEPEV
ncbi:pyridoxamine 5'-phosphate oxidase family protein [Cellulomonas endophytica]|uniref:pyridoxamine 5'-phosphate oxidase family protein n=1 Tax=Cellulomonas endophytica TaxID=2494735 RepID=UPI001011AA60|nr:TIGR03618 family F420-dependent PPOX class oxidoreductase [Cellulomonas endophytica]